MTIPSNYPDPTAKMAIGNVMRKEKERRRKEEKLHEQGAAKKDNETKAKHSRYQEPR